MNQRAMSLLLFMAAAMAADPLAIGAGVPALPVATLDGAAATLAGLRGQGPLVLMAWCSSCHSCRGAEGAFDALVASHRGAVPIYALAANPAETPALVRARQQASGVSFPVVMDAGGAVADALGVTCTTTVLVIAADGTLAYRGPLAGGQAALRAVLDGKRPAVAEVEQRGCPVR